MTHALNGTRWSDQFERVKRYLVRVQRHGRSHIEYEDDLWSFFVNAWALKDWVNNDEGLDKEARTRVVAAAENDFSLQICADLANRTKHIVLNKYSRHDAQPVRRDVAVEFGETQSPVWTHHIALRTGDTVIAQELAEDIVEVWQSLLAEFATVE